MGRSLQEFWETVKRKVSGNDSTATYEPIRVDSEPENSEYGAFESPSTSTRSPTQGYTELMGGSVPCPSCKGSGRIPKEMEETLVALIPFDDERLKPKRTFYLCSHWDRDMHFSSPAGRFFMLVPRAVELSSTNFAIDNVNVEGHAIQPQAYIKFNFMNHINVSNANYYNVQVVNTTAQIVSKFTPREHDTVGMGFNSTHMTISPLSLSENNMILFNSTVTLTDIAAEYCQQSYSRLTALYVNMQFDIVVSFLYFNHREQASFTTVQPVCCIPTGNCTSTAWI
ncbi:unnamed protein product [Caenorhabditis auriculariae]|uniref:Uncharacterized protein n=1 Tax=Caenorhabditis auriculariae TaxID=2777116 RepID=A0A8S1HL92_9PELO|nr:unnamed protein product [Caenorhabditis auriculariae]